MSVLPIVEQALSRQHGCELNLQVQFLLDIISVPYPGLSPVEEQTWLPGKAFWASCLSWTSCPADPSCSSPCSTRNTLSVEILMARILLPHAMEHGRLPCP